MAGWLKEPCVTHILGKSQSLTGKSLTDTKKKFQSTIGLPMAFGETIKFCWLPVIYSMGA